MRGIPTAAVALALSVLTASAGAQLLECRIPQKPQQVAELLLGRKIGDRIGVSEGAFRRFVEREIAPRFPDGLTVLDTTGHWRDRIRNRTIREPSKLVQIVLPGEPEDIARLNAIVEAYKARFRQQAVGVILRPACVSF
jgi:hypothetical protein